MAVLRQIVKIGDPILRVQAMEVKRFGRNLHQLLDDMRYTMHEAPGVGLAAPQVGISKQIVVIDDGEAYYELINPRIIQAEGQDEAVEYCLSVPGRGGRVVRATKIVVTAQNRDGEPIEITAEGFLARIFQHEIDHLSGRLFVDIMLEEILDDDDDDEEQV